ncbi:MAG: class I SAM-dependent methyltransferase [Tolypothrix carrinoi HA7290-LM1]|jgi:SAM-dependent methyltransferase|nr:class I SAM-dependent methyltransferase [Tolypothrix carrinoi HA7290-LM1]
MSNNPTETTSDIYTNPLNYFSGRAEDYQKYRNSYPSSAIDTILAGLEPPSQLIAADIGAGTGIGSRLLAERGVRVLAIEPNADMRTSAKPHPLVQFSAGTAEQTQLPTGSVNLVVSFQAFHWFNFIQSLKEFRRILKPSGRLALVWSIWDHRDAFSRNYSHLISKASKYNERQAQLQLQAKTVGLNRKLLSLLKDLHYQLFWQGLRLPYFTQLQCHQFTSQQELDLIGLVGCARSQGFIPLKGAGWEKLVSELTDLYNASCDESGRVRLNYRTRLYLAIPSSQHG